MRSGWYTLIMAHYKTSVSLGMIVRGGVKREMEAFCHLKNLDLRIEESKGVLESTYFIEVEGGRRDVNDFAQFLANRFSALPDK